MKGSRLTILAALVCAGAAVSAWGCGGGGGGDVVIDARSDARQDPVSDVADTVAQEDARPGDTVTGDEGTSGGLNLTGTWAQRNCQNEHYQTTLGGGDGTRVSIALITLTQTGLTVTESAKVCDLRVPPITGTQVTFPAAAINSIPQINTTKTLDKDAVGAKYETGTDPLIQLVAWNPSSNPASEALPTVPTDPRVYDQDSDGKPGATVLIDAGILGRGELYVVARAVMNLTGTVKSPTEISGTMHFTSEQVTLDASKPIFKATTTVTEQAGSTFKKVKLPTTMTCDQVVSQENTFFGGACPAYP